MTILIPVLGDQLSLGVSSLQGVDPADARILMMEVAEETGYVRHHKRKIAFILSAMRHHAARLRDAGWQVDYIKLDDPDNQGSFSAELARAVQRHQMVYATLGAKMHTDEVHALSMKTLTPAEFAAQGGTAPHHP